ncbi:hypothetical protein AB0H07_45895 [Streptomyces sp. NPDC021354]|uniref:Thiolase C-terminal domain-containing protein n=2 Tax=Streptomyces TaxID=1883 RepID=A0ABU2XVJ6_9ACTN|nr:hypothetical protein [Streptomyces sp. DSM 41529]MDT0549951.1 hypothetical protein [Streptomyces sp. DSM 41529]
MFSWCPTASRSSGLSAGCAPLGHPLGASGARLAGAVAHQLAAAGSGIGLASLCIGVGQGMALVLER